MSIDYSYSLYPRYGYFLHLDAYGGVFPSKRTVETLVSSAEGSIDHSVLVNGSITSPVLVNQQITNETITLSPTRTGYDFVEWSKTPDGPVTDISRDFTLNADMTFYAVWKPRPVLTFNANAESFGGLETIRIPASDSRGNISASLLQLYVLQRGGGATLNPASPWNTQADGYQAKAGRQTLTSRLTMMRNGSPSGNYPKSMSGFMPTRLKMIAVKAQLLHGVETSRILPVHRSLPGSSSAVPSSRMRHKNILSHQAHLMCRMMSPRRLLRSIGPLTLVAGRSAHNTNQSVVRTVT